MQAQGQKAVNDAGQKEIFVTLPPAGTLTEKDLAFLKSLGIALPAEKPKKEKVVAVKNPVTLQRKAEQKTTAPPPYYAVRTIFCECCHFSEIQKGKMSQHEPKERFLRFSECEIPEGETHRAIKLIRINCPKCYERLVQMSQHELALRVMKLVDANARKPKEVQ